MHTYVVTFCDLGLSGNTDSAKLSKNDEHHIRHHIFPVALADSFRPCHTYFDFSVL